VTVNGVEALREERENVLAVARTFTADEWQQPSDCAGWRVQDVVAHMACVFRQIVDPTSLPPATGDDVETNAEPPVAQRRDWPPEDVVAEYEEWSAKGIDALDGLQVQPMADTVVGLGNLGSHPLHLLADALVFDHYCHLRNDVLRPLGPIDRPTLPQDDARLRPIMTWMFAGLPQMNHAAIDAVLTEPLRFAFEGPGGGTWTLRRGRDGGVEVVETGRPSAATVHSSADDFVVWGTKRRPWRERDVRLDGDEVYAAALLDCINVI
jgi:uncharacterized protein (TIGR03083 family)